MSLMRFYLIKNAFKVLDTQWRRRRQAILSIQIERGWHMSLCSLALHKHIYHILLLFIAIDLIDVEKKGEL
jgi:hypothetical protein